MRQRMKLKPERAADLTRQKAIEGNWDTIIPNYPKAKYFVPLSKVKILNS